MAKVSRLKLALRYAKLGWAVLPLHNVREGRCSCGRQKCQSPGKHPITPNGVKGASTRSEVIKSWWTKTPKANIGLATGSQSGVIILDVDPRNGGDRSLQALVGKLGALPEGPISETGGGGWHYVFKWNSHLTTTHNRAGRGLDVLSDGAYACVPPSVHQSGSRYRWKVPPNGQLPELPSPWLIELSGSKNAAAPRIVTPASEQVLEGNRNTRLTAVAGRLWTEGLSKEALVAALLAENRRLCHPPLDAAEVEKIAWSISRYEPRDSTGDEAEDLAMFVLDNSFSGGRNIVLALDGNYWNFERTHWKLLPKQALQGIVLEAIRSRPRRGKPTDGLIRQATSIISAKVARREDVLRFNDAPPPVVNCRNGELWIDGNGEVTLKEHDPASFLRHCLDVDYRPTATCPKYDRALRRIFSAAEDCSGMIRLWHELAGYIIQPDRRIPIVAIGRGSGSNGKTSLAETLIRLLGTNLVAATPVNELERSQFAIGNLLGKLLFYDDDVATGTKLPDGQLKKLSEGKTVTGEHKFQQPFTFKVRVVPLLLCNNPPSLADLSQGMIRRLIVLPFDHRFDGAGVNRELFPDIWATEMSGVLNRALQGLKRVVQRNWSLTKPRDVENALSELLKEANPLPAFIDEACVSKGKTWLADLYAAYERWASRSGVTRLQQKAAFKRNLQSQGFHVVRGNQGDRVIGISLAADH